MENESQEGNVRAGAQRIVWEVREVRCDGTRVPSALDACLAGRKTEFALFADGFFHGDARTKPKQPAGPAGDPLTTKTCAPIKNTGVWRERACFNYTKLRQDQRGVAGTKYSLGLQFGTLAAVCHRHYTSIRECLIMHVEYYC